MYVIVYTAYLRFWAFYCILLKLYWDRDVKGAVG